MAHNIPQFGTVNALYNSVFIHFRRLQSAYIILYKLGIKMNMQHNEQNCIFMSIGQPINNINLLLCKSIQS